MARNHAFRILLAGILLFAVSAGAIGSEGKRQNEIKEVSLMKLTSTAFEHGETIPLKHSCEHDNISPALSWGDIPEGTKSFTLITDDPDAPVGDWVHWLVYNIPPEATKLDEYIPDAKRLENGALQGRNDFRKIGYGGPCPPEGHGVHHYHFKLYALDKMLDLEYGASKKELEDAMKDHVLDRTQLIGLYER